MLNYNNGIITVDGEEMVKVVRFDNNGFSLSHKEEYKFYDGTDHNPLYLDGGCFVFLRFVDTYALSGAKSSHAIKNVSYIPTSWEVYARNGVRIEGDVYDKFDNELDQASFILTPVTKVLERMYRYEESPINGKSKEEVSKINDGIQFDRYSRFRSCEVILTEEQVEWLSMRVKVVLPRCELYSPSNFEKTLFLSVLYENILMPVVKDLRASILYTNIKDVLYFRDEFGQDLELIVDIANLRVTVDKVTFYDSKMDDIPSFLDIINKSKIIADDLGLIELDVSNMKTTNSKDEDPFA